MQKYYFRTFIFSNSQIEILVSFSKTTIVNVNLSFRNSNFEGNFSTYVFGKPFCHYRDLKSECWTSRHILCKKILNSTLISLVHNTLGEMEWCEKRAFQLLKMRKMKVSWNIKTKCVTDFLLTVRSSSMKDYTCHYVVST